MKDETMAGFFKKYGGVRARPAPRNAGPLATMPDDFLRRTLADYETISATGHALDGSRKLTDGELATIRRQIDLMLAELATRTGGSE